MTRTLARSRLARHATTALKPPCPWCGASTSVVWQSQSSVRDDGGYLRRRQCAECRQDWPTLEVLDRDRFRRDLRARGLRFADLGLPDD